MTETAGGEKPDEGAIAICFYCGHIGILNADLSLREPTTDECIVIHQNPYIRKALALRKMAQNQIDALERELKTEMRAAKR